MDIKEIMDQVIELTGVPIDQFKTRRYINDAVSILSSLYDTACSKKTIAITCSNAVSKYSLPNDCFGVSRVELDGYKYNDYTVEDGNIKFGQIGNFEVKYIVNPKLDNRKIYEKELSSDIPPINEAYHRPICFYVAAQLLDINNPRTALFNNKFTTMSEGVNNKLKRPKRSGSRIKAPLWR